MTSAPLFRTPSSTPPKHPSTPLPTPTNGSNGSIGPPHSATSNKSRPLKLHSPSNSVGWSGPPSLLSSSGPSSPGFSESTSKGSSSEMSSSIISGDGLTMDNITKIFPTAPGLDQDLGMLLDSVDKDISGSMEFSEYYTNLQKPQGGESGDVTPVSGGSELDFNTDNATAGSSSTADLDLTVIEDIDTAEYNEEIDPNETLTTARVNAMSNIFHSNITLSDNNLFQADVIPKLISPLNTNINICTNLLHSPTLEDQVGMNVVALNRIDSDKDKLNTSSVGMDLNKDTNIKLTKSNTDRSSVTHGFNLEKK
ncbi:hypothetical protein NQ317_005106 [Molorchus minor]|uniref:Uncharacterized protein n=1 Tax=Molorchus minor TaxID=1323400 RepID=A0ABQ9JR74_9CUCU|nr:hypothetical protein NQ317_005106 [Molorchus minor]